MSKVSNYVLFILLLVPSQISRVQHICGSWQSFDDDIGVAKLILNIFKKAEIVFTNVVRTKTWVRIKD